MEVLLRYAEALRERDSKLVLVSADENIHEQLAVARVTSVVGSQNIYTSDEWVGRTFKEAYRDAVEWVEDHRGDDSESGSDG